MRIERFKRKVFLVKVEKTKIFLQTRNENQVRK